MFERLFEFNGRVVGRITIKNSKDIKNMQAACDVTVQILDAVGAIIEPGISTEEINTFVHRMTLEAGAQPAPLDYKGFPKSVCTSVNEVVCHGIPSSYVKLKAGDIINVDVTSIKYGFHGDSSRMYFVGGKDACSQEAQELVAVAKKALEVGIAEVAPGKHIGDIGAGIEEYIESTGIPYGIVREYTGHGLGRSFHEAPQVVHVGRRGSGPKMKAGMTFTIEPMINLGTYATSLSKVDGWTVRTRDGKLSAQWEHTVLVTPDGCQVMTGYE